MKHGLHLKIITDITSESLVSEPGSQFLRDNAQEEEKLLAFLYLNHFYVQEMFKCYCSTHSHHRMRPVSCKQRSVFPSSTTTFKLPCNPNRFMILLPASAAQQNPCNIFKAFLISKLFLQQKMEYKHCWGIFNLTIRLFHLFLACISNRL